MTRESEETGIQLSITAIAVSGITLDAQTAKMVEKGSLPSGELLRGSGGQGRGRSGAAERSDGAVLPVGRGKLTALLLPSLSTARTPKK
jgi:hypothetical protein